MAEIAVSALSAVGNWLLEEDFVASFRVPPKLWRQKLKEEWEAETGEVPQPSRPRHTDEEVDRFWAGMEDDAVDPRLHLAAEIGAEYRIGQVLRANRSDLDLTPGAGAGHGVFIIRGRGKKKGEVVFLTRAQRVAVDAALAHQPAEADGPSFEGLLANFEKAWQRGTIKDYPLFPGGRLRNGKATMPSQGAPFVRMSRRTLLTQFGEYEAQVGIAHVRGRAWYGLRRRATDRTRRATTDERVRDAAGGWTSGSSTREGIYMEEADPDVLREAAAAREQARGRQIAESSNGIGPNERREELAAVLRAMDLPKEKIDALLLIATL